MWPGCDTENKRIRRARLQNSNNKSANTQHPDHVAQTLNDDKWSLHTGRGAKIAPKPDTIDTPFYGNDRNVGIERQNHRHHQYRSKLSARLFVRPQFASHSLEILSHFKTNNFLAFRVGKLPPPAGAAVWYCRTRTHFDAVDGPYEALPGIGRFNTAAHRSIDHRERNFHNPINFLPPSTK